MKILAIETSCDETAVCLIEASGDFSESFRFKVLGDALYSQVAIHAPYGGVFPNLAKREHAKNLVPLLEQALKGSEQWEVGSEQKREANTDHFPLPTDHLSAILSREPELLEQLIPFLETHQRPDIDCIAVTKGPGLEPALWVGVNFAKALSTAWKVPVVGVNHMEGHVLVSMIRKPVHSHESIVDSKPEADLVPTRDYGLSTIDFPLLSLLISGGHTELELSKEAPSQASAARRWMRFELVGQTRDDAVGEAFDKAARLLGLPYPGGPEISRLAAEARAANEPQPFELPRPMLQSGDFDFSFSGLKTAVRRIVEARPDMTQDEKRQLAREFEDAAADVLVAKTLAAAEEFGARTILVGGGVSANRHIRLRLAESLAEAGSGTALLIPPPKLATDNALMIALAGYFHAKNGEFDDLETLRADGNLKLA